MPKSLCQPHVPVQQSDNDVPDLPPREPLAVSSDHLVPCRMGSARARQSGRLWLPGNTSGTRSTVCGRSLCLMTVAQMTVGLWLWQGWEGRGGVGGWAEVAQSVCDEASVVLHA